MSGRPTCSEVSCPMLKPELSGGLTEHSAPLHVLLHNGFEMSHELKSHAKLTLPLSKSGLKFVARLRAAGRSSVGCTHEGAHTHRDRSGHMRRLGAFRAAGCLAGWTVMGAVILITATQSSTIANPAIHTSG